MKDGGRGNCRSNTAAARNFRRPIGKSPHPAVDTLPFNLPTHNHHYNICSSLKFPENQLPRKRWKNFSPKTEPSPPSSQPSPIVIPALSTPSETPQIAASESSWISNSTLRSQSASRYHPKQNHHQQFLPWFHHIPCCVHHKSRFCRNRWHARARFS